jgi:glutamate-1-semialdehyde aminotransferase
LGNKLKAGLDHIAEEHGQPMLLQGFPGAWVISFTRKGKVINHADGNDGANHQQANRFAELLKERGVLTSWRFCTSTAHTEVDVEDALDRANDAMAMKVLKEEFGST